METPKCVQAHSGADEPTAAVSYIRSPENSSSLRAVVGGMGGGGGRSRRVLETEVANGPLVA